jgi:hypothetical protein
MVGMVNEAVEDDGFGEDGGVGRGRFRLDARTGFGAEITMDPHRARVEGAKSGSSASIATSPSSDGNAIGAAACCACETGHADVEGCDDEAGEGMLGSSMRTFVGDV